MPEKDPAPSDLVNGAEQPDNTAASKDFREWWAERINLSADSFISNPVADRKNSFGFCPGFVLVSYNSSGKPDLDRSRTRWDTRDNPEGKKYTAPNKSGIHAYAPFPDARKRFADSQEKWMAEGEGETLKLYEYDKAVLGTGGCWMWHTSKGNYRLNSEFRQGLRPNDLYIVAFDGDWKTNEQVRLGAGTLLRAIEHEGAKAVMLDISEYITDDPHLGLADLITRWEREGEDVQTELHNIPRITSRDLPELPAATEARSGTGADDWGMVMTPWDEGIPAPQLPRGILPEVIETLAFDNQRVHDPLGIAISCLVTAASAIGASYYARVTDDFAQPILLWAALLAASGTGKTPAQKKGTRILETLQHQSFQRFDALKLGKSKEEIAKLLVPDRLYTSDITTAAIAERLKGQDHGILVQNNELSTVIAQMDTNKSGKYSSDNGAMINGYEGGPYMQDRASASSRLVRNWHFSVLGGITLDSINNLLKSTVADGMLARFSMIKITEPPPNTYLDYTDSQSKEDYEELITALVESRHPSEALYFSSEARDLIGVCKKEFDEEKSLYSMTGDNRIAERYGKYRGLVVRYAGLFHVLNNVSIVDAKAWKGKLAQLGSCEIEVETVAKAMEWVRFLARHDSAFYKNAAGETNKELQIAQKICHYILRRDVKEPFNVRDLTQNVIEFRNAKPIECCVALIYATDGYGWIRPEDGEEFWKHPKFIKGARWEVNPLVHIQYAALAARLKERATADVEAIQKSAEARRNDRML